MTERMTGTILVVDDTPANRYATVRMLKSGGHEVLEADTGTGGLSAAAEHHPDLVVLDVKLPDMIGFEVTRRLKHDPATQDIPILQVSSSYTDADARAFGLDAGADAYLTLPVAQQVLLATVGSLLRLQKAERELREAVRARDEFLAIASHDLRTPLMALQLKVEMIKRGRVQSAEQLPEQMDGISQLVRRLIDLLEGLLDISQINTGAPALKLAEVDLCTLAEEVLSRFNEVGASGVSLSLRAPERVVGRWDRMRVEQVLANLLSNAIKYGAGKPVEVSVAQVGDKARLQVRDQGVGIPADAQKQIFQRFHRVEGGRQSGSYGLGLWIVKELVSALGGGISVQSAPGQGSTFTVELPVRGPDLDGAEPAARLAQ